MRKFWRIFLSSFLILALLLTVGACGSPQPTPTPLNMEELRSLVSDAVAESLPEESGETGITEEQLQSLVERAIADSVQPGLTAQDVEALVQDAVESAMAPGVTLEQVEQAIATALAAQPPRTDRPLSSLWSSTQAAASLWLTP